MNWSCFPYFAFAALACWIVAAASAFFSTKRNLAIILTLVGLALSAAFIAGFWIHAGRPPFTSTGETRLWYIFFLMVCGLAVFIRYRYRWVLGLSTLLAIVFSLLNIFRPELLAEPMMPILKSIWFVPHVIVYIFAYGMLGIAFLLSTILLFARNTEITDTRYSHIDSLTQIGTGFLLAGICLGALWAKDAWGYFWTWDPKETWALITILAYSIYIGMRKCRTEIPALAGKASLWMQIAGFICLQMCWYGVNFLKASQGLSVHIYG